MTTRERWLIAGIVLLGALLVGIWLWDQVRYQDAVAAVAQYVRLEAQAESNPSDENALFRQARPELRRHLTQGAFERARRRLAALAEEQPLGGKPAATGNELSVEQLWPEGSKERERVRAVLRSLVEKQQQGYNIEPVQQTLLLLAEDARRGDKKAALARFEAAEQLVQKAALRPGFAVKTAAQPAPAPAAPPGAPNAVNAANAKVVEYLEAAQQQYPIFIRALEQSQKPEDRVKREALARVQPLVAELLAAYRQGKDLTPLVAQFQQIGQETAKKPDLTRVQALVDAIRSEIPKLPNRPPDTAPPPAPAAPPMPGKGAPVPPSAPARPALPGTPGALSTEQVLQAIDGLRKLPDAEYQQRRGQLAMFIASVLARGGGMPGAPGAAPAAPPHSVTVGTRQALALQLSRQGELLGLAALGQDLSAGLPPGRLQVQIDAGKQFLPLPLRQEGKNARFVVAGPAGRAEVTVAPEGAGLVVQSRIQRGTPGVEGQLILRVPVRLAGWRWQGGGEPEVIAYDGTYALKPDATGKVPPLQVSGPGGTLSLTAPTAAAVSYDPAGSTLSIQLPIPKEKGPSEHTVRISTQAR